jgi:hypothetical protein
MLYILTTNEDEMVVIEADDYQIVDGRLVFFQDGSEIGTTRNWMSIITKEAFERTVELTAQIQN